jgi:hypothetical protein
MRHSIKFGLLALLASTALISTRADAAPMPGTSGIIAALDQLSVVENAQVFYFGGRRYCWYDGGWNGPGWYWCGYPWRRGFGWGGPRGWQGWHWGGWGPRRGVVIHRHHRHHHHHHHHHGMGGGGMGGGGMGGGGMGGGGMGGGGMGGGGMGGMGMSDIRAKHAITLLGQLDNGLGFYRFSYLGSDQSYVGVMAQELEAVRPDAVVRHSDGYLRVDYDKLGFSMQTYEEWVAAGERIPTASVH